MTEKLFIYRKNVWEEQTVYNAVDFDERLDEQLDTGEVQVINTDITPFEDFCMAKMELTDGETTKTVYFYAFDSVEKRGGGYYIHKLELVEPTRLLMGTFIGGRKVTQPLEGTKKSLYDVTALLLSTVSLQRVGESPFFLVFHTPLLSQTVSPEFHWEEGTSLWECLCDIGNVIDCIPRLTVSTRGNMFNRIVFDKINETDYEYDLT